MILLVSLIWRKSLGEEVLYTYKSMWIKFLHYIIILTVAVPFVQWNYFLFGPTSYFISSLCQRPDGAGWCVSLQPRSAVCSGVQRVCSTRPWPWPWRPLSHLAADRSQRQISPSASPVLRCSAHIVSTFAPLDQRLNIFWNIMWTILGMGASKCGVQDNSCRLWEALIKNK